MAPSRRSARRLQLALGLGLLALAGCQKNYENPFDPTRRTQAPTASAALVFSSNSHLSGASPPRDLFAIEESGAAPARLTTCGGTCDVLEGAPAADRRRVLLRQILTDSNGDRRLTAADGVALVMADLAEGVQGTVVQPEAQVSGVDWGPSGDVLVYSATGDASTGGLDDIFRVDPNGMNARNLTASAAIQERRPRFHPGGQALVYERIEPGQRGQVWLFQSSSAQSRITAAGSPGEALANTPYTVGADADPAFSPDGRQIVFRRLRALGNGALGVWDILRVNLDGSALTTLVTGAAFRGAPDWGPSGIVFQEVDLAAGRSTLVLLSPDGTNRRVPLATTSTVELNFPRWLRN